MCCISSKHKCSTVDLCRNWKVGVSYKSVSVKLVIIHILVKHLYLWSPCSPHFPTTSCLLCSVSLNVFPRSVHRSLPSSIVCQRDYWHSGFPFSNLRRSFAKHQWSNDNILYQQKWFRSNDVETKLGGLSQDGRNSRTTANGLTIMVIWGFDIVCLYFPVTFPFYCSLKFLLKIPIPFEK